ncbi:MAG: iron-containing alcohol dehydrogenase [Clostridia bacterium]|nr:iron-containing alcohol dehydrogenase [Clostridia bacterium]
MAIKEESFRIGCGRYLQGKNYTERVADEVIRLGTSPLFIGGMTALSLTKGTIEKSLEGKISKYEFITHTGTCNDDYARKYADYAKEKGYDVIVGIGGGVIMDLAKLCGHFAPLPVINVPTSSATCASYTPLSVRYTDEGKSLGTMHFDHEISCVIADTAIISGQPARLLLSGMFDAIAKLVEIKHRYKKELEVFPLGLDYAYAMSERSFDFLYRKTEKCISDCAMGEITFDVENFIYTTIAATGVISGIARGSNQTALGHKLYDNARLLFPRETKPYLHGEIVGVGLLMQNHFNGEAENNDLLISLMDKYGMPKSLSDIGIAKTEENYHLLLEKMCGCSAMQDLDGDEAKIKLHKSFDYLWNI